ncbi:MAG: hypothetical protein QM756_34470 [Polyangiaceae bacterium]
MGVLFAIAIGLGAGAVFLWREVKNGGDFGIVAGVVLAASLLVFAFAAFLAKRLSEAGLLKLVSLSSGALPRNSELPSSANEEPELDPKR